MSKLLKKDKFFDVSDYGRTIAVFFAERLKNTSLSPIQVTYLFGISGLLAVYFILNKQYWLAAFFLILKSILDALDGELARVKKTPSYSGRYLDSIFDSLLNFIFLYTIGYVTNTSFVIVVIAFACMELQGTLYNYYYVIIRNNASGADNTSKITETEAPVAFENENQKVVNFLYHTYNFLYIIFDKTIYYLDTKAANLKTFPNWFMTLVSFLGLGTQLLIIALFLVFNVIQYILPFFIFYTILVFNLILIRKTYLRAK